MGATRPPQQDAGDEPHGEPYDGCADAGLEFNPSEPPREDSDRPERPRPAPAPGVPVSAEEYERLKDEARRRRERDDAPAQEDVPKKQR
jgi:hypothetical protein